MPQPAHQPGTGRDQPVRGQGLVVVGRALEVRVQVITALQHLQGDIGPAGFRAPQLP